MQATTEQSFWMLKISIIINLRKVSKEFFLNDAISRDENNATYEIYAKYDKKSRKKN